MTENYFEVLRPGINTTFQDNGRKNFYHIGIPFSGAMDNRNFVIANALSNNKKNNPVIEFALQGPKLRFNVFVCLLIVFFYLFNIFSTLPRAIIIKVSVILL